MELVLTLCFEPAVEGARRTIAPSWVLGVVGTTGHSRNCPTSGQTSKEQLPTGPLPGGTLALRLWQA